MRSTWGTESLQMTTTKTKGRGKLPTLLLKTLIGWVCPARSSSPGVFAYWTSLLLLKQKDNANPCKICGPLTAISRTFGDTIQRHPKGHASDSEYVVLRFDTFLVARKLDCPREGCDFTTRTLLKSNLDPETHYRIGSTFIPSIERDFFFFFTYFISTSLTTDSDPEKMDRKASLHVSKVF